jgi:hypothetical protein
VPLIALFERHAAVRAAIVHRPLADPRFSGTRGSA